MKSALVISKNRETPVRIESCLPGYTLLRVPDREKALELVQKRRVDLIFADLDLVRGDLPKEDGQAILQPFWRFSPSAE
ncbi:MAG: hypothetical protein ACOCW9_00740, partial [Thermodesulfobacteriota bacterium]